MSEKTPSDREGYLTIADIGDQAAKIMLKHFQKISKKEFLLCLPI